MTTGTYRTSKHMQPIEIVPEEIYGVIQWHLDQIDVALSKVQDDGNDEHMQKVYNHYRRLGVILKRFYFPDMQWMDAPPKEAAE